GGPASRGPLRARPRRRSCRIQGPRRRKAARAAARRAARFPRGAAVGGMKQLAALLLLLVPLQALAGAQVYEPLADSVRSRLSLLVADRAPTRMAFRSTDDAQRWLSDMEKRLERRIPDRKQRLELLRTVHYE